MTTKSIRFLVLGVGLAAAVLVPSAERVGAQQNDRAEDAALRVAGRKVRVDKQTGKLRDLSAQEARELISTLTSMTTRVERPIAATPGGGVLDQFQGFDHVLVARPNEDGSSDVLCVSSVEEAVSFLSQQPKSSGKE
jgi:hypothetical protein